MLPRLYIGTHVPLLAQTTLPLPDAAARHVQVLRLQPGDPIQVFDGLGVDWLASVVEMGRKHVLIALQSPIAREVELPLRVTLAVVVPTNDRMDNLVEKATELGVHTIQPLQSSRSVLRLEGSRADKRVQHWQGVSVAACEQSGRSLVPVVQPIMGLDSWLACPAAQDGARGLLSLQAQQSLMQWLHQGRPASPGAGVPAFSLLSGPEGGFSVDEEQAIAARGWTPVGLGPRVLRADTAPLAALCVLAAVHERTAAPGSLG